MYAQIFTYVNVCTSSQWRSIEIWLQHCRCRTRSTTIIVRRYRTPYTLYMKSMADWRFDLRTVLNGGSLWQNCIVGRYIWRDNGNVRKARTLPSAPTMYICYGKDYKSAYTCEFARDEFVNNFCPWLAQWSVYEGRLLSKSRTIINSI